MSKMPLEKTSFALILLVSKTCISTTDAGVLFNQHAVKECL